MTEFLDGRNSNWLIAACIWLVCLAALWSNVWNNQILGFRVSSFSNWNKEKFQFATLINFVISNTYEIFQDQSKFENWNVQDFITPFSKRYSRCYVCVGSFQENITQPFQKELKSKENLHLAFIGLFGYPWSESDFDRTQSIALTRYTMAKI